MSMFARPSDRVLTAAVAMAFLAFIANAGDGRAALAIQKPAGWITSNQVFKGVVSVASGLKDETIQVHYALGGMSGEVRAVSDKQDATQFKFEIPILENSAPGFLNCKAVVSFDGSSQPSQESETITIPVALELELDITGDAAIALLYPIGGPEYTVRYVPCCNIFGGITMATRVPVNPEKNSTGLPEKILSDFMILSPDGLSASTMGMYMDFLLGPDRFEGVTPALYEFNGREWVEFSSYEVDPARGYVSMHCPNGGTFVIAAKP